MLPGGLVGYFEQRRDRSPNPQQRRDAERVLEDLRSLCRAAQAFEEHHGERASLPAFLEHAAGLHAQELTAGEDRRITVSTIHRAKGTEAALVALLACEERLLPSWRALESADGEDLAEERRLFYVAATRAKDRLLITHAALRGGRPTAGPSRFLTEAGLLAAARVAGRLTSLHPPKEPSMTTPITATLVAPARTHAQANELLRRPFAPGAIGFRAMSKTPLDGDPYGGAQIAAYLAAQSVVQRLNCVAPRTLAPAVRADPPGASPRPSRRRPRRAPTLPRLPADPHPAHDRRRARRRGRLRGHRRDATPARSPD